MKEMMSCLKAQTFGGILGEFKDFPYDKTITQVFEEQVLLTPNQLALVCIDEQFTYSELNQKVNQLAYYLRSIENIQQGSLIAICMDKKKEILISILAILKTGAAYVPIEPGLPAERILYILKDTKPALLLVNADFNDRFSNIVDEKVCKIVEWESLYPQLFSFPSSNLNPYGLSLHSKDLAYIIYTSGSSGKPKGVMVEHIGVINLAIACAPLFGVLKNQGGPCEKFLWYSNFVFDAHVWEIFTSLLNGHILHIIENELRLDIPLLQEYIKKKSITIALLPPALLDTQTVFELKTLILGGENTTIEQLAPYKDTKINVMNAYGLTETTVISTLNTHFNKNTINSIGRPIFNTQAHVLDMELNHVPLGEVGELYLSGVGIARGYLNDEQLTQRVYLSNPFQSKEDKTDKRYSPLGRYSKLFKTGDLVQSLADGSFVYKGRSDFQIKLRGYRIELQEIEAVLNSYPNISRSVVTVKESPSAHKFLIGYFISNDEGIKEEEVIKHLSSHLPPYMIPHRLIQLSSYPLNFSGKIDLSGLPDPLFNRSKNFLEPSNEIERQVRKIWALTLRLEEGSIGIQDDFFELGGNSILAIRLACNLSKNFEIFISTKAIFNHRTIEKMVKELNHLDEEALVVSQSNFNSVHNQSLSFGQERLYFIHQLQGGSSAYNIPLIFKINDNSFDLEAFKASIKKIIERHEILRTHIDEDKNGNLYQWAAQEIELSTIVKEASVGTQEELHVLLEAEISHVFDFAHEAPLRIVVCQVAEGDCHLSFLIHHMVFDGWSVDLFFKELGNLYLHYAQKQPLFLPELSIQYKDFATWQRSLGKNIYEEQCQYWKAVLEGYQNLALMPDKPRPQEFSYRGKDIYFSIDTDIGTALRELAKQLKVSLYSILLSAYCLMLRAYTQQDDIIVGSPVANRHYKGIENLLGFFVNTLPFRSIIDSNRLVVDYILNVSQGIIDLQMHQDVPLEKIVAELNIPKDPSQSPLFQVLFGVQSFGKENFCPWLEEYKPKANSTAAFTTPYAKFNLSTMMDDGGAEIKGVFNHATDIFEESTVKCFLSTYLIILKQFVQLVEKKNCIKISDINFFDQEEYNKIVYDWNHTRKKMDSNKTIHELFEEQVEKTPESIAVVYENKKLTYRALNEKANRLAHYLRTHGVGPETLVPIACERSLEMIVGIMGILKAGGAYVPLDPAYPMERQEYILNETKAAILLTHSSLIKQLPRRFGIIVELDQLDELISDYSVGNPEHLSGPDNGVYVIYTSGSTGKPKGVLSLHRGCVNRLLWMKDYCGISSTDRLLQKTSFAFDVSVWELLMPLVVGASVVFAKPGGHKDPDYLIELINTHKITLIHFVPSMLQEFISHDELTLSSLRQVICSGEALSTDLANQCRQKLPHAELYNFYGPTEASIEVSFYHCLNQQNGHSIPIGKPIWNTSLYILDDALHPVPVGVIGELYIGGTGLARGYLNDPELTNERFIKNPFAQSEEKEENHNTRLYRTGDLCRYLKNGNIEYIGRIDHQVKIDGFRIELGEIESFLLSHPSIREAAVLAREDNRGNKRLTVYYIINPDACIDVKSLRDYLRSKLPDYMIPSVFVMLKKMPLMANGKLDRKALPEPNFVDEDNYLAPTKNLEILIQRIWSDILAIPVPHLSINKNFFDLGGSSLLVLKLKSRIEQALGKKVLKVMDLFKYPTIKSLSDFLTIGFNEEVPEHFSIKPDGKASQHEIAVIAMSGAFSGSKDIQHFWSNLLNGESCVSRLSKKECEAINVSKAKLEHENYLGVGGLVGDADKFDPEFWGISVNDAKLMDPQIRKFLEHSYHALEYGGYINRRGGAKIGVFAGMNQGQYYNLNKNSPTFAKLSEWEKRSLSDPFQLATRVSYLLGLTGVSLTINTACSTSLVTIIEACKNLALGVCDAALAGGVAFTMPEDFGDIAEEGMIFSPDGCCRVFDKQANGTVRGSGVGVVLLKPLQKAREDKDPILAVIKGYAVNNDGNRKVGYTAPSPLGQVECISQAIEQAQVSPASIGYFECHGTGTTFGDAIEITALQEVVAKARNNAGSSCYLGSVKANIGHADTAAGVAGFIKGCKMLDEKMLPPQINYSRPNENLDFKNAHLSILTEKQRWEANGMFARRVGVSSFGIGGTNAHVVLEEYANPENSAILTISSEKNNQTPLCIVPISAKSKEAYREYCLVLNHFIEAFPDIALSDIALAFQHYREEFSVRNFFIGDSKSQLQEYLLSGTPPFEVPPAIKPSILQRKIAKEESSDLFSFYQAIGKLWCSGVSVTWELIDNIESVKKANSLLPGYSFQKLRCWLETEEGIDPLSCLSFSAKTRCKEVNKADVIEGEIIQAFSEVLGCSSIDKQSNFFALGGDSLSALRLAKKLSEIFGVKVSAGIVLKHDSIEKLISYWKNTSIKKSFEPSFIGKGEL